MTGGHNSGVSRGIGAAKAVRQGGRFSEGRNCKGYSICWSRTRKRERAVASWDLYMPFVVDALMYYMCNCRPIPVFNF
jgi:hypothetical protein